MRTLNEFVRELRNKGIEGPMAIVLCQMYDHMVETQKQVDMAAGVMLKLAETMKNLTALSDTTNERLRMLARHGQVDGVEVKSVIPDGDERK